MVLHHDHPRRFWAGRGGLSVLGLFGFLIFFWRFGFFLGFCGC